jgi:hypothetical protein
MDTIHSFQGTLQSLVGVICRRLEETRDHENEPFDAEELFEATLQEPGSPHGHNLQLAFFLQGSISQLLQTYAADRPWLVPTILTPLVKEILPAVYNELPKALRHQIVGLICGMLDEVVNTAASAPTNLLQYMIGNLKALAKSPETDQHHLPTVISLLGALAADSPLCSELDSLLSENSIRMDHSSPFFAMGKLRSLHVLLRSKPMSTEEIVEEILLRALPVACFGHDATTVEQRRYLMESSFTALTTPNLLVSDGLFLMCLSKASHPLSIEVCEQIIAQDSPRLCLAAALVMDRRTGAAFRRRLVSLLLRLPSDHDQVKDVLKKELYSVYRSKAALAAVLPLVAHFNISLDPPFARLLSGKLGSTPTNKLEQIAALEKAFRMCSSGRRYDFDRLLDHAVLPGCSIDDEDVLSAVFRVMYLAGPCANTRFPEIFKILFTKRHRHAKAVKLLLHISGTIPKKLRSHLQHCTSGNKELLGWIQARLNDTLFNPQSADVEAVTSKHATVLLQQQPPRSYLQRISISEGSFLLHMPTQEGRSAVVLFPPGDDSLRDIEFMLQGTSVGVSVLKSIATLPGGFQFQMGPGDSL